ncbi:unnamed protein product, partial [Hydatigera taeniaeformis]|uniref:Uncharacterized protein n=1 Tax=Hydatigena taeniaeformis TaxID=6205 RepID=A0A0R3WXR3_HYDTA
MPRSTRNSNASKKRILRGGNSSERSRNRTISLDNNKPGTPRKSLRSAKASPAPSVASSSASTVSTTTTTVTRSLRKRAPPSPEKETPSPVQVPINDGTGYKRRRVSVPPSPEPSFAPAPVKGINPTGRKRRGPPKEATAKRAKIALQGEPTKFFGGICVGIVLGAFIINQAPDSTTPGSSSSTSASLKRRHQAVGGRVGGVVEEEEEEHSSYSPIASTSATAKKRGAKRSRRAPKKSSAATEMIEPAILKPSTTENEDVKGMKEKKDEQIEKSEESDELAVPSPSKSPVAEVKTSLSKKELLALQRRQLLQHLDH